jgi:hypothetical protein
VAETIRGVGCALTGVVKRCGAQTAALKPPAATKAARR